MVRAERYATPPSYISLFRGVPSSGERGTCIPKGILCECQCSSTPHTDTDAVQHTSPLCRGETTRGGGPGREEGGLRRVGGDGDSCVLYNEEEGIATLTFNRPKSKHSFNRAVFSRLVELLDRAERSESILAVVITGAGGYFTSGADINELQNKPILTMPMLQQPFGAFASAVLRFPKLLVAAVNGPAVGVGVTLLPHCDVVYAYGGKGQLTTAPNASASEDVREERRRGISSVLEERDARRVQDVATFWTPFFRLAIVPEFCSSITFPEILGWSLANEVLVMGRKLSAQEAMSSGLVSTVVTADTEEDFLRQLKQDLRRNALETYLAAESARTFKQIMWRDRRPRLLRVLAEECTELDRRMKAGHPKAALKNLVKGPPATGSKL